MAEINIDAWSKDPEFIALPEENRKNIYNNFFDSKLADNEFNNLTAHKKSVIKNNFFNAYGHQQDPQVDEGYLLPTESLPKQSFSRDSQAYDVPIEQPVMNVVQPIQDIVKPETRPDNVADIGNEMFSETEQDTPKDKLDFFPIEEGLSLRQDNRKESFIDKLVKKVKDTTRISPARAANIIALSEVPYKVSKEESRKTGTPEGDYKISISDASKNYNELTKDLRDQPTDLEFYEGLMTAALVPIAIAKPVQFLAGMSTFMGVSEAENYLTSRIEEGGYTPLEGKQFSDLAPNDLNENTKTALGLLEIVGKASISGIIGKVGGDLWAKLPVRQRGIISAQVYEDITFKNKTVGESVRERIKKAKKDGRYEDQIKQEVDTFVREKQEAVKPETKKPLVKTETPKAETTTEIKQTEMTPEIIEAIPDPVVRAFAKDRLSTKPKIVQDIQDPLVASLIKETPKKAKEPVIETEEIKTPDNNVKIKKEYVIEKGYPKETITGQKNKMVSVIDEAIENAPIKKDSMEQKVTFKKQNPTRANILFNNVLNDQYYLKRESGTWSLYESRGGLVPKKLKEIGSLKEAKLYTDAKFNGKLEQDGTITFKSEDKTFEYKVPNSKYNLENFKTSVTKSKGVMYSIDESIPMPQAKPSKPLTTQEQKKRAEKKIATKEKQLAIEDATAEKQAVHAMIRKRRFDLNLEAYKTNLFTNTIERSTTKQQREALPFFIEGTEVPKKLNRPDLENIANDNKELMTSIKKQVQDHFTKGFKEMQTHVPDMSAEEIENYVTHIWDIPRKRRAEVTNWFTTNNRFLKQRYIDTLYKGIDELGLKPKTLDITDIIRIHDAVSNRAIQNAKFVKSIKGLKREGVSLVERADLAPADWVLFDHPALRKTMVIPGELKKGEKVSQELQDILTEMGVAIGRRISPTIFGKPNNKLGQYKYGEPPEVSFQRFMSNKTIAHEIGHHIDTTMGLGESFLNRHKTELYKLNEKRIKSMPDKRKYTESPEEQIAEAFAFLFTDPKMMKKVAPTAMADMLERLKQDTVMSKLVDFNFEKNAKNLIEEQLNTMLKQPVKVHPDLAKPLRVVFENTDSSAIMEAYDTIAGLLKKTNLTISLFHHLALGETGVATTSLGTVANIYFNPAKIYNALYKGEYDVFKKQAIAKDAVIHGVQFGATADIPTARIQEQLNTIATKTKNVPLASQITKFVASANEKWDKVLWDYLHDTLKLYAYESLALKIDPTKSIRKQKETVAQFINDTFGGQNWDALMISPKQVQFMTRVLLSADWTTSTMRQALAPTGFGSIHRETRGLRRKLGAMFWAKAIIYFGGGINMLNLTFREWDKKKNPKYYKNKKTLLDNTMYGNAIGHKTHLFVGRYEDGRERYIRWGKQFRELPEMIFDDTGFSPISASVKKILGKANPNLQLISKIATGHSLSGFKDDDIYGKKGWDWTYGVAKTLFKAPLPFSSRTIFNKNKEFHLTDVAMPSSAGMSRYKSIELFKVAITKKDDRFLKEVYQDALENNLPAYTLFNAAITSLKAEETKSYNSDIKTIGDLKQKLKTARSEEDIRRISGKLKRFIKESNDKFAGLALLKKAELESKIYNLEKGE